MEELETASGRIWIAIDLELASTSGRPKHTDIDEQGYWLFYAVADCLAEKFGDAEGAAVTRVSYLGQDPNGPVLRES